MKNTKEEENGRKKNSKEEGEILSIMRICDCLDFDANPN